MQTSLLPLLINVVQTFECLKKKMMKVANYPKYVSVKVSANFSLVNVHFNLSSSTSFRVHGHNINQPNLDD